MSTAKPVENKYIYGILDVCKAVGRCRMTLRRWEQEGKFKPPRDIGNRKVFTKLQLESIRKAFSPGGKGKWKFRPVKDDEGSSESSEDASG